MPRSTSLVATLIANPNNPVLTPELGHKASQSVGASSLYWLADGVACDIPIPLQIPQEDAEKKLSEALSGKAIDIIIQPQDTRRKKLLMADMDSTMIQQECIDELAEEVGLRDRVAAITAKAMNGEIEFEPALRERVGLLKDLPVEVIQQVIDQRITLMPGGVSLVQTMKKHGAYTALVSGGFTSFTQVIAKIIGFDEQSANTLIVENGVLTGEVTDPILGMQAKADRLLYLCEKLEISTDEVMAVGDGANDLAMLALAGSGVALHAKPSVAAQAKMRINYGDLTALLYIQGYRKADFVQ